MRNYFLTALTVCVFAACSTKKDSSLLTATDTGTAFIRASLDGDFKTIETLLLNDTTNHQLFESYRNTYHNWPEDRKKKYKEASYEINKMEDINDSTTIINYSNTYMNKPMEIKLVRENNKWLVDFKYTFSGNLPIN